MCNPPPPCKHCIVPLANTFLYGTALGKSNESELTDPTGSLELQARTHERGLASFRPFIPKAST